MPPGEGGCTREGVPGRVYLGGTLGGTRFGSKKACFQWLLRATPVSRRHTKTSCFTPITAIVGPDLIFPRLLRAGDAWCLAGTR